MVSVQEAFRIIESVDARIENEEVDILTSRGRVLAESIMADRDFPPFNRVAMDGIAVQASHFKGSGQLFSIEAVQAAGVAPLVLKDPNNGIEVMTGSVLPENTTAVVRYEDIEMKEGWAKILINSVEAGKNIHFQGIDAKHGSELLKSGQKISAAEVALFASVGKKSVRVFNFPITAVISSGDELVEIDEIPEAHQIRKSNIYSLQAAMLEIGWKSDSFHFLDDKEMVKKSLQKLLKSHDILILSGGVSKGKFDFIPEALEELGIRKLFHQVSQRPGKPFWFGTSEDKSKIVFALPGNPVSTFLCFYKYIKPWVMNCFGIKHKPLTAQLTADVNFSPTLTYFLQVRTEIQNGILLAYPNTGGGSGDFANLKGVDGFLELPLEKSEFKTGEVYPYIPFRQ